jgi:hypothetical protein
MQLQMLDALLIKSIKLHQAASSCILALCNLVESFADELSSLSIGSYSISKS